MDMKYANKVRRAGVAGSIIVIVSMLLGTMPQGAFAQDAYSTAGFEDVSQPAAQRVYHLVDLDSDPVATVDGGQTSRAGGINQRGQITGSYIVGAAQAAVFTYGYVSDVD